MSEVQSLKAIKRERVGKGSSRALRKEGKIPAVIYGSNEEPIAIAVPYKEIFYMIYGGGFLTNILNLEIGSKKIKVLPKSYELDPVRDFPLHVDFLRVRDNTIVTVNVPLHFINEELAPGIKQGGVLNVVHHELECNVKAGNIPDGIEINLEGLEIGDSIHLEQIKLPDGLEVNSQEEEMTLVTIVPPTILEEPEEESEGAEEEKEVTEDKEEEKEE